MSDWEKIDGWDYYDHITDKLDDEYKLDKDMMIRHCLLEVLDLLKIIEYSRGYDGYYYTVGIKERGK